MQRLTTLCAVAGLGAIVLAGCGGSSPAKPASTTVATSAATTAATPVSGVLTGTTSQGLPISLTVASGGTSVSQIGVRLHYTCPKGVTSTDSNPSGPTASVPATGGAFNATWTTYGVNHFSLSGHLSASGASGTVSGQNPSEIAGTCTSGTVTWKAAMGTAGSAASASAAASPAAAQVRAAGDALQASLIPLRSRLRADATGSNLPAFQADAAAIRNAFYTFDGSVRKVSIPASAQAQLVALLGADRVEIADLDAIGTASSQAQAVSLFGRVADDQQKTHSAWEALIAAA